MRNRVDPSDTSTCMLPSGTSPLGLWLQAAAVKTTQAIHRFDRQMSGSRPRRTTVVSAKELEGEGFIVKAGTPRSGYR